MKRILTTIVLAVLLCGSAMAKSELKWVDGTDLNICGHTIRNAKNPYSRLETKPYGFTNKAIIRYSQYSTGLYVMFKTNSSQISAEWSVASVKSNKTKAGTKPTKKPTVGMMFQTAIEEAIKTA